MDEKIVEDLRELRSLTRDLRAQKKLFMKMSRKFFRRLRRFGVTTISGWDITRLGRLTLVSRFASPWEVMTVLGEMSKSISRLRECHRESLTGFTEGIAGLIDLLKVVQ